MQDLCNILVVDDSEILLEVLKSLLDADGYQVQTVDNGASALELLAQQKFDLVICDIEMPGMSGMELLERIKKSIDAELPVILITGHITTDYALTAIKLGADDIMSKPLDATQLIRSVAAQVAKRQKINPFTVSYRFVKNLDLEMVFHPQDFLNTNLASLVIAHLQLVPDIPASVFNSLIIGADEMLNNAFIHGTFELTNQQRKLDHENLTALLNTMAHSHEVRDRRIRLNLCLNRNAKKVKICVKDDGPGFDYEAFLNGEVSLLEFSDTGRGIQLLRILADEVEIEDNGRSSCITKYYQT